MISYVAFLSSCFILSIYSFWSCYQMLFHRYYHHISTAWFLPAFTPRMLSLVFLCWHYYLLGSYKISYVAFLVSSLSVYNHKSAGSEVIHSFLLSFHFRVIHYSMLLLPDHARVSGYAASIWFYREFFLYVIWYFTNCRGFHARLTFTIIIIYRSFSYCILGQSLQFLH